LHFDVAKPLPNTLLGPRVQNFDQHSLATEQAFKGHGISDHMHARPYSFSLLIDDLNPMTKGWGELGDGHIVVQHARLRRLVDDRPPLLGRASA
jgi:hypothetical protein